VTHIPILLTILTEALVTFVIFVRHDPSTSRATALTFTYKFFQCALLVFGEIRATSEVPIAVIAGDSNFGERTRRAGHAVATRLVADVRDVPSTCFVAPFKCVLFRHGSSKFCDHMIVSFDIIIKKINSLGRFTCSSNIMSS